MRGLGDRPQHRRASHVLPADADCDDTAWAGCRSGVRSPGSGTQSLVRLLTDHQVAVLITRPPDQPSFRLTQTRCVSTSARRVSPTGQQTDGVTVMMAYLVTAKYAESLVEVFRKARNALPGAPA